MKHWLFVIPIALAACDAGTTSPTAPTAAPQFSKGAPPTVQNLNEWQAWGIDWFDQCTLQSVPVVAGTINIHNQQQLKFGADGSLQAVQHINAAGMRLTDVNGIEYVFQENQASSFELLLSGTYEGDQTYSYKVISKGRLSNEFVDLTVHYAWDGVTFLITSSYVHNCRGSGN